MDKTLIINKIIEHYNFKSDADFARFLGIRPQTLSNWKSRNTYDAELLYTKCVNINPEWLLTGEGELLKTEENSLNEQTVPYTNSNMPKLITVDSQGEENIVLVPVSARAGYLKGYGDPSFIGSLPTYRLPRLSNGTFRMFEVKGQSMIPTLHDRSIVVGEWVENWNDIKDNQVYIVVTDEGVVVKRVLNRLEKYGNLYLKSDNRSEYPSYTVTQNEIKEVWKVNLAMIFELLDPSTIFDRVNDLEAEILNIKGAIQQNTPKKS
ncbi:LexA family transcriptional regulator [Formosa sp. S-31]|uniref:LexA family transcriptional regulator n=1 Tax=Formosa sp. S-31 TaxID=2790949 RepID=UPI003EBB7305